MFPIGPDIQALHHRTLGSSEVCVAVLDGLVDQGHPCFAGATLSQLKTLIQGEARSTGQMSHHGTHVASIIWGQPGSPVEGIAPQCRGLIVPVFADQRRSVSQLDLARGIEQAISAGAHIINISGGELTDLGEAEAWLENAVRLCQESNVLLVAAAGNDGCNCLHVPAALPAVLAVGAMDALGHPIDFSNWGKTYQNQGILAPGEDILGAVPQGETAHRSGTSFATPIVTGVAALLLSLQLQQGEAPDPQRVREILLQSALPCDFADTDDAQKCLVGKLNLPGAVTLIQGEPKGETMAKRAKPQGFGVKAADCGCGGGTSTVTIAEEEVIAEKAMALSDKPLSEQPVAENLVAAVTAATASSPTASALATAQESASIAGVHPSSGENSPMPPSPTQASQPSGVMASQAPNQIAQEGQLTYALGTLGYDFGSEARRDSFKQLMPAADFGGTLVPANPYDARQMVDYLGNNLAEARSLIWTLNIELTPVYAIEPKGPFAREVYQVLQELLSGQIQAEDSEEYVERVSIPGMLTGRTVKLFSGQVVPVIEPQNTRGLYGWTVNTLVNAALATVQDTEGEADEEAMRRTLGSFLNRVYYDLRNLGTTSQDRALNFAVTNAFQAASTFSQAVAQGMELDSVTLEKSPFCRMDSDCWDVKLKFFDPENSRRAKKIYRFTIDVSDIIPVTLGEVKSWSSPY